MSEPFISYSQHGEDVILWRALGGREQVRYVDVGGYHPTNESVTRALYERGWRGVNIEAFPARIEAFEQDRPEDLNVAVAVGDHDGTALLAVPQTPGWETIREPDEGFGEEFGGEPARIEVPLRTLATLLPELGIDHVDVLKIDVEGAEAAVVRGLLDGRVRPTVCVVEGTSPGFGREAGDEAVGLLTDAGYQHAMFDGLNHYLTNDPALVAALSVPASPVDEHVTFRVRQLEEENARLQEALRAAEALAPVGVPADASAGRQERRTATMTRLVREPARSALAGTGSVRIDPLLIEHSTPQEAVAAVYRAVLGRDPDQVGLTSWSGHIAAGGGWLTVAERMAGSEEALRRPADDRAEVERTLLAGRLARALSEIAPKVARRGPYTQGVVAREMFVEALFEVTLGREPDADERTEQVALLANGAGRGRLVREFLARPGVAERILGAGPQGVVARVGERLHARDPLPLARARIRGAEARRVAGLALAYLDAVSGTVSEG